MNYILKVASFKESASSPAIISLYVSTYVGGQAYVSPLWSKSLLCSFYY